MTNSSIDTPDQYFRQLGGLHDSRIDDIIWTHRSAELAIRINNINANFRGLPEYRGEMPAVIRCSGVTSLHFDIREMDTVMCIAELKVTRLDNSSLWRVQITTWSTISLCSVVCQEMSISTADVASIE
jgi:hypothetical protein